MKVTANGLQIEVDDTGGEGRPVILLIMGLGMQLVAWPNGFVRQLVDAGFRVVRHDNRDIGLSQGFDHAGTGNVVWQTIRHRLGLKVRSAYTLQDMALDSLGVLDALGIARAHIVGASMGGAIGQELAIHHPRRMRSFTSIMSTTGNPALPPPTAEAMAVLFSPAPTTFDAYVAHHAKVWRVLRGPSAFPLDEARDAERAQLVFLRGLNPPGVARQLAAILASGNRKPALRDVRVPTLVIHGDADPLVPVACGVDVADAIAGAALLRIPRMGHALPIEMWPQIVDAIAAHTARHSHD